MVTTPSAPGGGRRRAAATASVTRRSSASWRAGGCAPHGSALILLGTRHPWPILQSVESGTRDAKSSENSSPGGETATLSVDSLRFCSMDVTASGGSARQIPYQEVSRLACMHSESSMTLPRDRFRPYSWRALPHTGVAMIGAILLGLFCGVVARMLVPGDAFKNMSGWRSWLVSLG